MSLFKKNETDSNMRVQLTAKTHVGMVRELNEDNFIATNDIHAESWVVPEGAYMNSGVVTVCTVADGMGGMEAGEVASGIVVQSVKQYFGALGKESSLKSSMGKELKKSLLAAHQDIISHSADHPETEGMGSTAVVAVLAGNKLHYAWCGDSRCYLYRKGRLTQLTKDHSYVQSLVDEGRLTKEQAFLHPESNIVTQSLGDKDRLPQPESGVADIKNGDIVILCSDGLNSMLMDTEIENILNANANNISNSANKLIEATNAAGGADNTTLLIIGVGDIEKNPIREVSTRNPEYDGTIISVQKNKILFFRNKNGIILVLGLIVLLLSLFILFRFNKEGVPAETIVSPADSTETAIPKSEPEKSVPEQHHTLKTNGNDDKQGDDRGTDARIEEAIKRIKKDNSQADSLTPIKKDTINDRLDPKQIDKNIIDVIRPVPKEKNMESEEGPEKDN